MRETSVTSRYISFLEDKHLGWVIFYFGLILLIGLLVGLFCFLLVQDVIAFGKMPQDTVIAGVSVENLSKAEVVSKLQRELFYVEDRPLTIAVDDERYSITPEEIGLQLDYEGMADKAYREAWSVNIFERMLRRFAGRPWAVEVPLEVKYDEEAVEQFVTNALGSVNRAPVDASVDATSGVIVILPALDGRGADQNQLLQATEEVLEGKDRIAVAEVRRTPAAITAESFGNILLLNLATHTLSLYQGDTLVKSYPIACGQPAWPTPTGRWKIRQKIKNPTWVNPGASWAKTMPPFIPPGPGNPLGTRALALNASGVLIHGTRASGSIGRSASHGCIRMHMRDVEDLFERVEVGTPVYIIKSAGDESWKKRLF